MWGILKSSFATNNMYIDEHIFNTKEEADEYATFKGLVCGYDWIYQPVEYSELVKSYGSKNCHKFIQQTGIYKVTCFIYPIAPSGDANDRFEIDWFEIDEAEKEDKYNIERCENENDGVFYKMEFYVNKDKGEKPTELLDKIKKISLNNLINYINNENMEE